jgi:hypothetical protein
MDGFISRLYRMQPNYEYTLLTGNLFVAGEQSILINGGA